MAQEDQRREKITNDGSSISGLHNRNVGVASTDAYADVLDIDCRNVRTSVFTLYNKHATSNILYEIWATAEWMPNQTNLTGTDATDYDNGWVQIKAETTLTASAAPTIESLSNPYNRVVVRIKAASPGNQGTLDIYHRGES
jgi:hypothetical protein